jgi:hypothetical protein
MVSVVMRILNQFGLTVNGEPFNNGDSIVLAHNDCIKLGTLAFRYRLRTLLLFNDEGECVG